MGAWRMDFKYLSAAFGSAMITSVYSIVDTAMVGQYHGPEGTAALAVVAPVWNIIYSLGLLMGIWHPHFRFVKLGVVTLKNIMGWLLWFYLHIRTSILQKQSSLFREYQREQ